MLVHQRVSVDTAKRQTCDLRRTNSTNFVQHQKVMFKGSNDESSGSIGAPSFNIFVKPGLSSKDTAESGHNTHSDLTKHILEPLEMCKKTLNNHVWEALLSLKHLKTWNIMEQNL